MVTFLCSTPLMCRNGEFRALTRIDKVFTHGNLHEHEKGHMIPREAEKSSGSYEKKILLSRWYIQREKGVLSVKRLQTYREEKAADRYNVYSAFCRGNTRGGGD